MGSVLEKVQLVKDESARIGVYLKSLKSEAWSTPSACDAWEVQDVVAHLTGAVDRFGPNIIRGVGGDGSAPEGMPPAGEGDMAALRAWLEAAGVEGRCLHMLQRCLDEEEVPLTLTLGLGLGLVCD